MDGSLCFKRKQSKDGSRCKFLRTACMEAVGFWMKARDQFYGQRHGWMFLFVCLDKCMDGSRCFLGGIFWGRKARMEVVDHRITASETIATPPRGRPRCLTRRSVRGACTCTTAASSTAVQQQSGQFTCFRNVDLYPVWQPATVLASRLPVTGPAVVADFLVIRKEK